MKPLKVLSKFENYSLIRTVSFQVHLEAGGYFLLRRFLRLHLQQAGIQHKNTLVPHLNGRWISKFLGEKFVFEKSAFIRSISHQTGTITSGFEGKKRKYHFLKIWTLLWYALSRAFSKKRKHSFRFLLGSLLKSTENRKECFLKISASLWYAFYKPSSNLENRMTVCMEYSAMTPKWESRKTPPERGQESHAGITAELLINFWKEILPMKKNMFEFIIDSEFQSQIPALTDEEFQQL